MTKVQECLAKNMKLYRKISHLTQEQLAERVETSTNYIGTIETGKKFPSPHMIERIAMALNIDSLQLFQSDKNFEIQLHFDFEHFKANIMANLENAVDKSLKEI